MQKRGRRSSQFCFVGVLASLMLAVTSNCASAQSSTTYTYDALGRVKGASHSGSVNGDVSSAYEYDAAGNRTKVVVLTNASGGNCTFSPRDGNFSYDWEFPSNSYWVWVDISGTCTSPTTIQYTFSRSGAPSGTFVVQPSQASYYYYEMPAPCSSGGTGNATTKIKIISGPGTVTDDEGAVGIFCD